MPVAYGVYVNNRAAVFLGEKYPLAKLVEVAELAEELGFDFVSVGDSLLAKPRYSPIPLLAHIAARTRRVRLATGILQPHMYHPVRLAQDWATLDVLSGGRTIFAVGLGTGPRALVQQEYELIGIPMSRRGKAFEESIEVVRKLWTEAQVTYSGSTYHLHKVSIGYGPMQRPHPPIIIAAGIFVPRHPGEGPNDYYRAASAGRFRYGPLERVARLGDGWITGIITPEEYAAGLRRIRVVAEKQFQRTLNPSFLACLNCFINVHEDGTVARSEGLAFMQEYHRLPFDDETVDRWLICGNPEQCADRINRYVAAGVNTFQLVVASPDQAGQIRRIAAEVLPLCRR
ncbi:MAG: LLM class flavin-dependent oxidoreductase [Armatimonadota bacterium]|nr:LLM class flavin-dependent oxidoreductase [Armatimonadota bacterium]MDR7585105.1 LLM class flavin-dependent oxidoreductase [Armatimonadota bacterium]